VSGARKAGEPAPAGDQHCRAAPSRKQRRYLALADRIVEHHQDPPAGQQVAIDLRALVQALRYLRAWYAQRAQEPLEYVHRAARIRRPVVQAGEQLPAAELPGRAVRCMYGSAGLAHSALAGDHHDGDREPACANSWIGWATAACVPRSSNSTGPRNDTR
jgi:hypothetical protein